MKFLGPYELLGRLSTGGMAEVHRARDTRTDTRVALKQILPDVAEDEEFLRMFEDEAAIASELEHPHIARLLDYGREGEQWFIAYELVEGTDLRGVFDHASLASEPVPLPVLLYIFARIAEGLSYAHGRKDAAGESKSIVHRDVSPQNIMVSLTGDVKLIDFGIAKAKGRLSRTAAGTIKGKFGYMSPEGVRGRPIDSRTDVFSLGICMWELLTLKRLFTGTSELTILDKVKNLIPAAPSDFRHEHAHKQGTDRDGEGQTTDRLDALELDRIVLKALAKDPDQRYRSAREFYKDLYAFIEKTGAAATREDVARYMTRAFPLRESIASRAPRPGSPPGSMGRIMDLQETRMSEENKGGSDLDIFEGLGKKSAGQQPAAPPPPPGTTPASVPRLEAAPTAPGTAPFSDAKRTLLGTGVPFPPMSAPAPVPLTSVTADPPAPVPSSPPPSASMAARPPLPAPSKPPPPPGRGSLPSLPSQPPASAMPNSPSSTMKIAGATPPPPPASTRPGPLGLGAPAGAPTPVEARTARTTASGRPLEMEWEDEEEATHVFDKESSRSAPAPASPAATAQGHATMDEILARAPAQVPAAGTPPPPASNGLTSAHFKSGAPAAPSVRSAPPPPPNSVSGAFNALGAPRTSETPPPPPVSANFAPPPPPPGQTTTAPMHMPPPRPPSAPPGAQAQGPMSNPPVGPSSMPPSGATASSLPPGSLSSPPMPQMPPVSRAMEATQLVPRQQSNTGLIVGLLLAGAAAVGAGVFFLLPRTGTVVVNVADAKGGAVSGLEVYVDDAKLCDKAPCIVPNVTSGVHQIKVVAKGFDPPAPRAVTVEARKDLQVDFTIAASAAKGGTGFKVATSQPNVKLTVDGKEIGALPQELRDLTPGDHKLRFVAGDRYAPLEKTVTVGTDEVVDLGNVALKVLKGKATIDLGTPGAKVFLVSGTTRKEVKRTDGQATFPIAIDFDPNEKWELEATKDGFDEFKQPISFDDGVAEKTVMVTLNPKGTAARAAAAPAAAPAAAAPAAAPAAKDPAPAPAGKEPPAWAKPAETPAAAPAAKTEKKDPNATVGGDAFLNINSLPASTVALDGRPLGPTPQLKIKVSAGSHTILFVNSEQSLKKSITVNVGAGETKAAFAKLRD